MLSIASMLGLPVMALFVGSSVHGLGLRSAGTATCGEITCQLYEFCSSEVDHQCRKCSVICDSKARNYDENTCDQFCQDYIHDYVREYIKRGDIKVLKDQIDQLKSIVSISLLLGILLSILALLTGVFVWIRYRKYLLPMNSVGNDYNKEKEKYIELLNRNNNTLGVNADPTIAMITPPSTLPQVLNVAPSDDTHHPTTQTPPRQNTQYNTQGNQPDARYNTQQDTPYNKNGNNNSQNGSYTGQNKHPYNSVTTQNGNYTPQNGHYKDLPSHAAYPLNISPDSSATSNEVYFPSTHGRSSTTPHGRSSAHGRRSISPPSTASTQLIGQMPRYPSEDATLEHAAYDNLAMTPTPPRTTAVTVGDRY
uniref:Protein grindelwald n=1 Tax=Cacopsylla melanoneura TaxID=428564 RepID=A0A8D8X5T9_9HEMI